MVGCGPLAASALAGNAGVLLRLRRVFPGASFRPDGSVVQAELPLNRTQLISLAGRSRTAA